MANIYKPRYKQVLRTKSKIWAYKNSRLKGFYDLRGVVTFRKGFWHRRHLKLKNAKWFQGRRFILPKKKQRLRRTAKYQEAILDLKRIRMFYGKFDAYKFKMLFFKSYQNVCFNRIQNFLYHLEQRADIVLFRLKFLPTIFACHNFIKNHGILINNKQVNYPHTLVKIGDIISMSKDIWWHFYYIFERKIFSRLTRTFSLYKRRKKLFKRLKDHFKIFKKKQRRHKKLSWLPQNWKNQDNKKLRWLFYKQLVLSKLKNQLKFKEVFQHGVKLKKQIFKYKLKKLKLFKFLSKIKQKLLKIKQFTTILNNKFLHYTFLQIYFQVKKIEHQLFSGALTTKTSKNKNLIFRQYLNKTLLTLILQISKQNNIKKLEPQQVQKIFNLILQNHNFLKSLIFSLKNKLNINKVFTKRQTLNFNLFKSIKNIQTNSNSNLHKALQEKIMLLLIPLVTNHQGSLVNLNSIHENINMTVQNELKSKSNQIIKSDSKSFRYQKFLYKRLLQKPWKRKHFIPNKNSNLQLSNSFQDRFRSKLKINYQKSFFNRFPFQLIKKWLQNKNLIFLLNSFYNKSNDFNAQKFFNFIHRYTTNDKINQAFYYILQKQPNFFYFLFKEIYSNHTQMLDKNNKMRVFMQNKHVKNGWKLRIKPNFKSFSIEKFNLWTQIKLNALTFWSNLYNNHQATEYENKLNFSKPKTFHNKNFISHQYYLNIVKDYFMIKKQIFYLNYTIQYLTLNLMMKYKRIQLNDYLQSLQIQFNKEKHFFLTYPKQMKKSEIRHIVLENVTNFINYIKNLDKKSKNLIGSYTPDFYYYVEQLLNKTEVLTQKFFTDFMSTIFNHFVIFIFAEIQKIYSQRKYELINILSRHNLFVKEILNKHNVQRYARKFLLKKRFYQYLYTNENLSINLGKNKNRQIQIAPLKSYQNPQLKRNILRKTWWHRFKQKQKGFLQQHHWFIPKYMEFDFKTLRGGIIREPVLNEIIYPFNFSLKRVLMHYKDRGY